MEPNRLHIIIYTFIASLLVACNHKGDEVELPHDNRTVLVYMLADNNLATSYHYDSANIEAMGEAIARADVNGHLLIYRAAATGTELLQVRHSGRNQYAVEMVKTYDHSPTSVAAISEVMASVKQLFDTRSYGLVLWSHATGWLPQNRFYAPSSFGREGAQAATIDIDSLRYALGDHHFDFIICDACLMGSVEVAYELRHNCDYFIASPTEVLASGFPYAGVTPLLFDEQVDYEAVCKCYYDTYIAPGTYETGTIALVATAQLDSFAHHCRNIICSYTGEVNTHEIQHYDRTTPHIFYDLGHYMATIANDSAYVAFTAAMEQAVPYKAASNTFINIPITHYSGLSSYVYGSSADDVVDRYYTNLQWYKYIYN